MPPTATAPALAGLREVPFTQVEIKDAFWAPRREVNRKVSLRHSLEMLEKFGNILDLDLAAQEKREGYKGPVFMDSDLYKCLESVSYSLATDPDPELDAALDGIIAKMAAAQRPDGYLNTWYEVNAPEKRFTNLRDNHELYCAGHLFEAAAAHARATGKKNLLAIATKYADLLCATFGEGPGKRAGYCGHPEVELALVKLADVTGEKKYFELAAYFVNARGGKFFAQEHNVPFEKYDGDYFQDNCPIREHDRVVGHAVRFAYLMSGCVDVGVRTGDESLLRMTRRVWRNTTERNTFVTGGIGPSASNEGFTSDYDLPTFSAYQETCATVAMALWNHRLNLAYGDAKYADCVETALYNGVLSGVALDGKKFFYVNPMASRGTHHRSDWFGCACCPPNVTRTLASLGNYVAATDGKDVWLNLYVQGSVRVELPGGGVTLGVTTEYPWDGKVKLDVKPAGETPFALRLRVPGWCGDAKLKVNGQDVPGEPVKGYLTVSRAWKAGDTVELDLDMTVRRMSANPNAAEMRGRLALARGPLVYCVEGVDLPEDARKDFWSFTLPPDAPLATAFRSDLLGGVVTIMGEGYVAEASDWSRTLYQETAALKKVGFTAVPYCAWDNRGAGPMEVWIPTSPPATPAGGPEAGAALSISYKSNNADPEGIHDGAEPKSSGEQPAQLCHWWPHKGGVEWVGYAWSSPRTVSGVRVYWFDDTGRGECRLPASWRILAKVNGEWTPIDAKYRVAKDAWCEASFPSVSTSELRLEVTMQEGWAAGVHEWKVIEAVEE
jgi:DUF1680 family protein